MECIHQWYLKKMENIIAIIIQEAVTIKKGDYMGLIFIFCTVMLAVFVALKLANVIAWSWLWVFAPLWIPIAIALFLVVIGFLREFLDSIMEN